MKTELFGALRKRRDALEADLEAIASGEAGVRLTAVEAEFFRSRLLDVNRLLSPQQTTAPSGKRE